MFRSEGKKGVEAKEQAKLSAKTMRDQERMKRILDPKVRKMGIDVQFIEQQRIEKQRRKELDALRDAYFDEERVKDDQYACFVERKRQQQRAQIAKDVENYRKNDQRKELQREWDLNDPDALKKDQIGRVFDFHGEDLGYEERKAAQARQLTSWLKQQEKEKMEKNAADRAKEHLWQEQQEQLNFVAESLDDERKRLRREKLRQLKEFNLEQARAKRERDMMDRERDDMERQWEIHNQVNSDLLNERHENTVSAKDEHRYKPDSFKGMSDEQKKKIMAIRERQIAEKQNEQLKKQEMEDAWAHEMLLNDRTAILLERQQNRLRSQLNKNLAATHKRQMQEQAHNAKALEELYAPKITEDFFQQFQKSDR